MVSMLPIDTSSQPAPVMKTASTSDIQDVSTMVEDNDTTTENNDILPMLDIILQHTIARATLMNNWNKVYTHWFKLSLARIQSDRKMLIRMEKKDRKNATVRAGRREKRKTFNDGEEEEGACSSPRRSKRESNPSVGRKKCKSSSRRSETKDGLNVNTLKRSSWTVASPSSEDINNTSVKSIKLVALPLKEEDE